MKEPSYKSPCYVGADPGLTGGIAFLAPHTDIPCMVPFKSIEDIKDCFTAMYQQLRGDSYFCVMLEKVGSHGQEGRASLGKFLTNYGEWRGLLGGMDIKFQEVRPQEWQKLYRDRLPVSMSEKEFLAGPIKVAYKPTAKEYRRYKGRIQTERKNELMRIALELGAPQKTLSKATADAYLLAIHARDYAEWL